MENYLSIHSFFFVGHEFWKERIEYGVKLLESNILNCCIKKTTANLLKIKGMTFQRT